VLQLLQRLQPQIKETGAFRSGTEHADQCRMAGVRTFEELIAWQSSVELRDEIFKLTASGPASRNFDFRDQIRDSASSAPRNIAEGFRRFNPKEFANFANIAKGSLGETQNHLKHGLTERYLTQEDFDRVWPMACRAAAITTNLFKYLSSCRHRPNFRPSSSQSRRPPPRRARS